MRIPIYIFTAILIVACGKTAQQPTLAPRPVKVTEAQPLSHIKRDFAALSTADDAVNLAFKISGRVVDIPVAKGYAVRKGEVLAELDKRDIELQVDAAKAAYDEAESRLRRAERLAEHNAISQQEVEALTSAVTQRRTAYENSLDLLNDTRIIAPFDGVVERTYVDAFQRVASGETIVRIVAPISTTVGFTAPEDILPYLDKPTTLFTVRFDAYPDTTFRAVIKSFARTSSDALGFPVSLRLTNVDNSRYRISPGMTCMATVDISLDNSNTVSLPLSAIYAPIEGGEWVWVVNNDECAELRAVTLGEVLHGGNVEVSGVSPYERVVVAGVYKLQEGERVTIIE